MTLLGSSPAPVTEASKARIGENENCNRARYQSPESSLRLQDILSAGFNWEVQKVVCVFSRRVELAKWVENVKFSYQKLLFRP